MPAERKRSHMKINLEVEVSEAMEIHYALLGLAERKEEKARDRRDNRLAEQARKLTALAQRIEVEAHNQLPH